MRLLTVGEADSYLNTVGFKTGEWNQITDIDESRSAQRNWVQFTAPRDALELLNFSQHIVSWVPKGDWKILQLDDSTNLDKVQFSLICGIFCNFEAMQYEQFLSQRSFFFDFGGQPFVDVELIVSNLIYFLLIFECHGYLVSSDSEKGRILSIHDGVAYFSYIKDDKDDVHAILDQYRQNPLLSPDWIRKMIDAV